MLHVLEFRVFSALRIEEMFDFSHVEFTDTVKTVSRCDFITETKTDLSSSEGNATTVEFV